MVKLEKHNFFIFSHMIFILLFSLIYYLIYLYDNNTFSIHKKDENISFMDFLYFSLVTQTTVGYGGIIPTKNITRMINLVQLLTIYGVIAITIFI
jgi:hypothetical protein